MISNLLVMVIVGGYETFVSRLNLQGHPDQPEWLSHVNASVLKIKLAMAIIGISSIHLLRTFIEAGNIGSANRSTEYTETGIILQTVIHTIFILSAIGIAWVDRMTVSTTGKAHWRRAPASVAARDPPRPRAYWPRPARAAKRIASSAARNRALALLTHSACSEAGFES